jgi:hypothetical protein
MLKPAGVATTTDPASPVENVVLKIAAPEVIAIWPALTVTERALPLPSVDAVIWAPAASDRVPCTATPMPPPRPLLSVLVVITAVLFAIDSDPAVTLMLPALPRPAVLDVMPVLKTVRDPSIANRSATITDMAPALPVPAVDVEISPA